MNLTRRMFLKWAMVAAASPGPLLVEPKFISIPAVIAEPVSWVWSQSRLINGAFILNPANVVGGAIMRIDPYPEYFKSAKLIRLTS